MSRSLTLFALVVLSLSHSTARASEYFVSPRSQNSANGTSAAQPFGTIQKAVSVLKAGDTLTILPGEYQEAVEMRKIAGTKEAPITIRAQRPGTVLLRGDVEVTGWNAAGVGEHIEEVYAVKFNQRVEGVADARTMAHYAPVAGLTEIGTKPGAFFHDEKSGLLLVRTPDARPPGVLSVSITNGCGLGMDDCAHIVVEGLAFTGYQHTDNSTKLGSRTRWGLIASKCQDITVRRCVAYLSSGGFCFTANTSGSVIEECEAFGNVSRTVGISNQILGWAVKDCVFRRNRIEGFTKSGSQDQITFYSSAGQTNMIAHNVAVHGGYMDKGDAEHVSVTGNISTGPRPQYYKTPDASNMRVSYADPQRVSAQFADPVNGDFRLLPESPQRGKGLNGADPGPQPYREEVYFVSPDGDDASPGLSPAKPWKTLQQAAARAKAGDTIYLLPGVYEEALIPAQSGTAERPIRFARRGDGRVVLDGKGTLPVGIDLAGRSHITVEGLGLGNFTSCGVKVKGGEGVALSHLEIGSIGGDGVAAKEVRELELRHCLVDRVGGVGVRLDRCAEATLMGNVFGVGTYPPPKDLRLAWEEANHPHPVNPRLAYDAVTLATLWSDRNAFENGAAVLIEAAATPHAKLADWQKASALDAHSLEIARDLGSGDVLRGDSPLIGRGPRAGAIGPFRRMSVEQAVPVERAQVHSVTATTANLECLTPSAAVAVTVGWNERGASGQPQTRTDAAVVAHTISLTGLKPDTSYHAHLASTARETLTLFAIDRDAIKQAADQHSQACDITFDTRVSAAAPRTLHVATDGDDGRDGLSRQAAWRTLNHAAAEAVAGDTVLVHAGTYEELVTLRGTGDEGAPLTFRAAPGEVVWLTGSDRLRSTAFLLQEKSHVVLDGFRFRDFLSVDGNHERVVAIIGGSHHVVRRCFYDGRVPSGYMNVFLGVSGSGDCVIENCVVMLGMGEGMAFKESPGCVVRHCVFYNNNIRALSLYDDKPGVPLTLSHNLVCAVIPAKGGSPFYRVRQLQNFIADHNGYFDRIAEEKRGIVEVAFIGDKEVGAPAPGSYNGKDLTLADLRAETGQEKHSIFGNPGIKAVKQLSPRIDKDNPAGNDKNWSASWMANELHQTHTEIELLDFADFFTAPDSAFANSAAGEPIGLERAAFAGDFARATNRGEPPKARTTASNRP